MMIRFHVLPFIISMRRYCAEGNTPSAMAGAAVKSAAAAASK